MNTLYLRLELRKISTFIQFTNVNKPSQINNYQHLQM